MRISFATHMPWSTPEKPVPTNFRQQIENELASPCGQWPHPGHGFKRHTLRRMNGALGRFRPGMELQLVQGPRFKAEQFATAVVKSTQLVYMGLQHIPGYAGLCLVAEIDGKAASNGMLRDLSLNDGFRRSSLEGPSVDFLRWFMLDLAKHGEGAYELIHWTKLRY